LKNFRKEIWLGNEFARPNGTECQQPPCEILKRLKGWIVTEVSPVKVKGARERPKAREMFQSWEIPTRQIRSVVRLSIGSNGESPKTIRIIEIEMQTPKVQKSPGNDRVMTRVSSRTTAEFV
jgi:hypothetical protein